MIQDTLAKIEAQIQGAPTISDGKKVELAQLVSTLRVEIGELAKTHGEAAQSIAGFTQVAAHEAARREPNPVLVKLSADGLSASVQGFEGAHPRLVQLVNSFCNTLSNLGV